MSKVEGMDIDIPGNIDWDQVKASGRWISP